MSWPDTTSELRGWKSSRHTPEYTAGLLTLPDGTVLATIERPWIPTPEHHGGKGFESCVPCAEYRMVPFDSRRFGKSWALVNEAVDVHQYQPAGAGRYAILIHVGNRASDVVGCIAVGMDGSDGWIQSSRKAMNILTAAVPWSEHTLSITGG